MGRDFYARDPREVAVELLNKVVVVGERSGRIVEVEAYLATEDPAAHSYKGPTKRNATMWGEPGHLYVYFSYGMHWCCNPTCGDGRAVLLRALSPLTGLDEIRAARPKARRDLDLTNGPARLTQALGITGEDDGNDLVRGRIRIVDDGTAAGPPRRHAAHRHHQGRRRAVALLRPGRPQCESAPHPQAARMRA